MAARALLSILLLLTTAACRSPFERPDEHDEVGVGVHAWPVVEHDFAGGKERLEILWPLYIARHGGNGAIERLGLVATLINYERHPDGKVSYGLRPLYDLDTWEGAPDDYDLDLIWPLLKARQRGDATSFALRPLFWTGRDGDDEHTVLLPFFGAGSGADSDWWFVFPVLWSGTSGERSWDHVAPFYFSGEDEHGAWSAWFPVVWRGEDEHRRWSHLAPLYWSGETRDGSQSYRILLPFYWQGQLPDGAEFEHFWPLYGRLEKDTYVEHSVLYPFFRRGTDPETDLVAWDVFAPLFHYAKSDEATEVRALPLVWHRAEPGGHETILFPFWWSLDDGKATYRVLFPVWGRQTRGDDFERTFVGGPLFIRTRDGDEHATDVLWPLVNFTASEERSSFRILPLVMHEEGPAGFDTDVLWPLVNVASGDHTTSYRVFPLVNHTQQGSAHSSTDVLWPLYRHERNGDDWRTYLAPLLWAGKEQDAEWFHFWPFYGRSLEGLHTEVSTLYPFFRYRWSEADDSYRFGALWPLIGGEGGGDESSSWIFPLWFGSSDGATSQGRVGVILSNWETQANGDHDFRILWRLVEHSHEDDRSSFVVRPLWRNETNVDGDRYWSLLMGLLSRKEEGGDVDWRFLWVF